MTRTPEAGISIRREGFCRPRRIAPASRTLPSSSSNICLFTAKLLLDDLCELRDLFRSQIRRRSCLSIPRHANLAYPATAFEESAELRIRGDPGLKPAILLIA